MDTDDKTILRRLKRGDAAALEAAVRQYSGYVSAVIGNQLGPCAAAEDIEELASDVFVALWRAPQPLRTEHLRGWLGKVARNQAISFLRRQHMQLVRDEDCILVDDRDAQKLLEAKERSALLNAALAALTSEDREIFLRRYYLQPDNRTDRGGAAYEPQHGSQPPFARTAGAEDGITERRRAD